MTLTLTEALERATKGDLVAEGCYIVSKQIRHPYAAIVRESCDAALLAHCRNELPALVETALVVAQRMCIHNGTDECPICNLRAALHRAQTVKMI